MTRLQILYSWSDWSHSGVTPEPSPDHYYAEMELTQ
jgi:hypothetical protein